MLGERLRIVRESNGFTQEELAREMGVDITTVGRWERGKQDPNTVQLPRLAKLLFTTTDYLLGLVAEPSSHMLKENLTPTQALLVDLIDRGLTIEAMGVLLQMSKRGSHSVNDTEPAAQG